VNKIPTIVSIMLAIGLIMAAPSYCQEKEEPKINTIYGNVVLADWEKSTLTVKWIRGSGEIGYQETTLRVPEDLKISKDSDTIGLMDLEAGDHAIIEYYENVGMPTAKSITVEE